MCRSLPVLKVAVTLHQTKKYQSNLKLTLEIMIQTLIARSVTRRMSEGNDRYRPVITQLYLNHENARHIDPYSNDSQRIRQISCDVRGCRIFVVVLSIAGTKHVHFISESE